MTFQLFNLIELQRYFKNAKLSESQPNHDMNANEKRRMKMLNSRQFKSNKTYYLSYHQKINNQQFERFSCEFVKLNQFKYKEYSFLPTKKYEQLQKSYEAVKNTLDPQMTFDFLHENPHHVECLYDVSEYFRIKGDYKQANQIMEQLLYIYEESFGYDFAQFLHNDTLKICLSFDHNNYSKVLFWALLRFIDILGKKGCYKSSLEYNKILLKLNPISDPVGALLCIDFSAISARNYDYLIEFVQDFAFDIYQIDSYSILYMPNMIFSSALAKFNSILKLKGTQENDQLSKTLDICDDDWKKASDFNINHINENHNVLLITAILLYPNAMLSIITTSEINKTVVGHSKLKEGWQKKSWKEICASKFLTEVSHEPYYSFLGLQNNQDIEGLNKVIQVYLERSKILWRNNQIAVWVLSVVGFVLNKIDQNPEFYEKFIEKICTEDVKRNIPFQLRRYAQISKANFSDTVERLDLNNIPDVPQQQQQQHQNLNPMNYDQNVIQLFLNSLLPWNNLQNNPNIQNDVQELMQEQDQGEWELDEDDDWQEDQ